MLRSILALSVFLVVTSAMANDEQAPYTVVEKVSQFELRDYPALNVVEVPMNDRRGNGSFGKLLGFISGQNETSTKIPMTAPVFMNREVGTMAFVMPANMPHVPAPKDANLLRRQEPAGRFAVYRFSGSQSASSEEQALQKLREFVASRSLSSVGTPLFGYFDPPWTLPFLRRNEVMLRIAH